MLKAKAGKGAAFGVGQAYMPWHNGCSSERWPPSGVEAKTQVRLDSYSVETIYLNVRNRN